MKIKFLIFSIICTKIQCFRIFPFGKNYKSYIIDSIQGPRADELKKRLKENLKQPKNANKLCIVRIKYSISMHRNNPTAQIKYEIRTRKKNYTRYFSINIKNDPIPWNISSSFIEELTFHLKSDIQKSMTIISNKEKNSKAKKLTFKEEDHLLNEDKG